MAAASPRKRLKVYNFGTTNARLMKLTTIIHRHKTFDLAKNWGVTHRAQEGEVQLHFLEFSGLYQKRCHMLYFALHCITGRNFKRIRQNLGQL